MIIQCPKCLTKFKLDDSKVTDEGTRVRCAKCKEVFVATRDAGAAPPPPPLPATEIPAPAQKEEDIDFSFGGAPEAESHEAAFSSGGGEEGFDLAKGGPPDFSFGLPEEGGSEAKAPEEATTGPGWGGMDYGEVSLSASKEVSTGDFEAPPTPSFGAKAEPSPFGDFEFKEEPSIGVPQEGSAGAAMPSEAHPPMPVIEEKTVIMGEEKPLKTEFVEKGPRKGIEAETFPEEFPEEFHLETKAKKKESSLRPVFISILIFAIAAVPLWYFWKSYKAAETGEIKLEELGGAYLQNAEAGNVFIITGRAVNSTTVPRSFFQVKGILFDKKGEKLAQKVVYCGNIFSPREIATLPKAKIENDLKNKVGSSLSNINLAPGKSVPFTIVFFDLPKEMTEFSAEVVGSEVASE